MAESALAVIALGSDKQNRLAADALSLRKPDARVLCFPGAHRDELASATALLAWKPDPDLIAMMPKVQFVQSAGAGVDHLAPYWPALSQAKVARFVDDQLSQQLSRYVVSQILDDQIQHGLFRSQQAQVQWRQIRPRSGNRVLIVGLGIIGQKVAQDLQALDFEVWGWSRQPKQGACCAAITGQPALFEALAQSDYVVNLLPLTASTRHLINADFLQQMPAEACLINVGRGATVDAEALLQQLDNGALRKAVLDVFETEPLPAEHPFWRHPAIVVTPHIASLSDLNSLVTVFLDNLARWEQGLPISYLVDPARGY